MALGRGTAGTCLLPSKGTVLPRASCKDGGRKPAQGHKGTCPRARPGGLPTSLQQFGLTQPLFPCQGSHQPGPLLRDAGCQEEEGLLHQEALAARLALRGQRGPVAAQASPVMGACGAGLTLQAQGPASALPFLYCGGREGASQ